MTNLKTIFFILFFCLFPAITWADMLNDCMHKISDSNSFKTAMTNDIFPDAATLTQEGATQKKAEILTLVGNELLSNCSENLSTLAKQANGKVWYPRDSKTYAFQFKMPDLFQHLNIPTALFVYNKNNLKTGDVVKLSDIPKLYWSNQCSDHTIWDGLNDNAAVNIAGQQVFSEYGGDKNEFFLDFEQGNNRRAFPGLVLAEYTKQYYNQTEAIVMFSNISTADQYAQKFANALQNSACSNDSLYVYVVKFDKDPTFTNENKDGFWRYGLTFGFLIPGKIFDIQQLTILSGPYTIK